MKLEILIHTLLYADNTVWLPENPRVAMNVRTDCTMQPRVWIYKLMYQRPR